MNAKTMPNIRQKIISVDHYLAPLSYKLNEFTFHTYEISYCIITAADRHKSSFRYTYSGSLVGRQIIRIFG